MAYVAPGTVASGSVWTASQVNVITNDIIQIGAMSQGVFTNEAARDAAITSPTEGMQVYLTAPTVPAATGGITYVPSGIISIYNGSAWVCITPVSAFASATGTTTSTSFTATLSGSPGTNASVTVSTGTTALIEIGSFTSCTTTGGVRTAFAVSGATTLAASDDFSIEHSSGASVGINMGSTMVISGLTAGTNTFTLNYNVGSGTGSFLRRRITARGIA